MKYIRLILFFSIILFSCNNPKGDNKSEKETVTKESSEVADTSNRPKENPYKNVQIDIKVFKNDTIPGSTIKGFGYDIYMYKNVYVHQPHIPAINGNRGFDTEEQAYKAAELIVYKIKNNIMPPSVTPHELDSLGVLK